MPRLILPQPHGFEGILPFDETKFPAHDSRVGGISVTRTVGWVYLVAGLSTGSATEQPSPISRRSWSVLVDSEGRHHSFEVLDNDGERLQIEVVDDGRGLLATAGRRAVVIFMHHPPHATGFVGMDALRLCNETEFYRLLATAGNVRHIFAGHVHRTISGSCRGIPFSIFKSPVHQQPMTFDLPDSSLSVDEPAAYGIVFLRRDGILVHTEDYEISQGNEPVLGRKPRTDAARRRSPPDS